MTRCFPGFIIRAAFIAALAALPTPDLQAQKTTVSPVRSNAPAKTTAATPTSAAAPSATPKTTKAADRVAQIIAKSEEHFKKGETNLGENKREQARDEFDKAVDSILESGMDVRADERLQKFYLQLIERIYRIEVPSLQTAPQANPTAVASAAIAPQNSQTISSEPTVKPGVPVAPPQIGFRQQKFEPSPLDELSKLVLTPEERSVSAEDEAELEVAKNSVNFDFDTNPLIQQFINYYQGRGRMTMENGMRRSGRFMKMARKIFKEEGVPEDLTWLGQVESAWSPRAFSSAAASGLWQFVASTGRDYGLRQTAWIDERNSFEKATRASAKYLKDLARRYNGNWELAMAAYNTGAGNVDRAIARAGTANFWKIYPYIAQETRNYVPNILATILIAKNPEKFGFRKIKPEAPIGYELVSVPSATSLQLIADASDTSIDYLRNLNPELRRDVTPRGEAYSLRVPSGRAKQIAALIRRAPSDRLETARVIAVAPGEDLQSISRRTGFSLATLQAMNGGVTEATGNKLLVPSNAARSVALVRAKPVAAATAAVSLAPAANLRKVRARAGDTIASIAAANNVSAFEVARLNGMGVNVTLRARQEVKLPAAQSAPSRRRSSSSR